MSAVAVEFVQVGSLDATDGAEPLERRLHGHERSYADAKLKAWGKWIEDHSDFEGYPRSDAVAALLDGHGGGGFGSRPLIDDAPEWWWRTNARVLLMPEHEREAVRAHYIVTLKDGGGFWTDEEKATKLGLTFATFRKRVSRGRLRFLGIVPPSDSP